MVTGNYAFFMRNTNTFKHISRKQIITTCEVQKKSKTMVCFVL